MGYGAHLDAAVLGVEVPEVEAEEAVQRLMRDRVSSQHGINNRGHVLIQGHVLLSSGADRARD